MQLYGHARARIDSCSPSLHFYLLLSLLPGNLFLSLRCRFSEPGAAVRRALLVSAAKGGQGEGGGGVVSASEVGAEGFISEPE